MSRRILVAGAVSPLPALAALIAGWIVTAAGVEWRVPSDAVAVLAVLTAALACRLGCRMVSRRLGAGGRHVRAALLVGPALLGVGLVATSTAPWWLRVGVAITVVAAATGGSRRVAPAKAGRQPMSARRQAMRGVEAERGSGTLELVGVVTLAAILSGALIGVISAYDPTIRDTIWAKICQITGGNCSPANTPSNLPYKPADCEIYSGENGYSGVVDVAFVLLGGNGMVQRVEKSNGDIEITLYGEGRGGLVASAGGRGEFRLGDQSFSAELEAEAAITGGYASGETYVFGDRGSADAFQRYLEGELREDTVYSAVPGFGLVNGVVEWISGESAPDNAGVQRTLIRFDVAEEASAQAGFGYGAGASLEGSYLVAIGTEYDRGRDPDDPADDLRSDFYQVDWSAAAKAGVPVLSGISGSHEASGVLKVTRNSKGQPIKVEIVDRSTGTFQYAVIGRDGALSPVDPSKPPEKAGVEGWSLEFSGGPNSSVVVTQVLDLDTPEEQRLFNDWFNWSTGLDTALNQTLPGVHTDRGEGIDGTGAARDAFSDLMRREALVSVVEYDGSTWGLGGALEVGLGLKVGADIGYDSQESAAVSANYLGAPRPDGSRPVYALPECIR